MTDPLLSLPVVDFTSGALRHRLQFGGGRGQDLPRAVGMKHGKCPRIIDATAGQGKDAFLLASLGSEIVMIERSDAMHDLLANALIKAHAAGGIYQEIATRMTLVHGDSITLIPQMAEQIEAEVIVVDPMHPPRKKSALVNGDMRKIQALVGTDPDQKQLIETAIANAQKRVVVKWPTKADRLPGLRAPSHQITGKAISFDVFMVG